MPRLDTHKAVKTLTGAGFPEHQAEALIGVVGEERENSATNADIAAIHADLANIREDMATKADLAAVRGDMATKADLAAVREDMAAKADLRELELRMTIRLGGIVAIAAALVIAIQGFLLAVLQGVFG